MVTSTRESGLTIKLTEREPTFVWTGQSTLASGHRTSSKVMLQVWKKHGIGTFKWADSSMFIGVFYNNYILGNGVYMWSDDRKYEG